MKLRSIAAACSLLLASMAACGADDAGPVADPIALGDLSAAMAEASCERELRCGTYTDVARCLADLDVDLETAVRSAEAGRTTYDPASAGACVAATRDASCDPTVRENRVEAAACRDMFVGAVADNERCFADEECASTSCDTTVCGGTCCLGWCRPTPPPPVEVGQSCAGNPCIEGSYCNEGAICAPLRRAGETCTQFDPCTYGMTCGGTCVETPGRGERCVNDAFCVQLGDRCDRETSLCVAQGGVGAPCRDPLYPNNDNDYLCQAPLFCNEGAGVCEEPPDVGQPCNSRCAPGAFCQDGVCEAGRPNGAVCIADVNCASRYCEPVSGARTCLDEPVCG